MACLTWSRRRSRSSDRGWGGPRDAAAGGWDGGTRAERHLGGHQAAANDAESTEDESARGDTAWRPSIHLRPRSFNPAKAWIGLD
jgi:hypothetical protein